MPNYNICPYCGNTVEIADGITQMLCPHCQTQLYITPPGSQYPGQIIPPGQEILNPSITPAGNIPITPDATDSQPVNPDTSTSDLKLQVSPELQNIAIAKPVEVDIMSGLLDEISSSKGGIDVISDSGMIKLENDAMNAGNTVNLEQAREEAERIKEQKRQERTACRQG